MSTATSTPAPPESAEPREETAPASVPPIALRR